MAVDNRFVEEFARRKTLADTQRSPDDASGVGGSGGLPHTPDTEARVTELEDAFQGINVTLARMDEWLAHLATEAGFERLRTEMVALAGKVDGKANATDLAELKGRVCRIPTVPVLASMLAVAGIVVAIRPWIVRHIFS